jgi:creatinine amidohydrolase
MELRELSWAEVQDSEPDVAVLPVASTEQHGPHNPVGLDSIVANEMAREATAETDTLMLPPVEVGLAEHHRGFPGTLYVRPETLKAYVYDVLSSVAEHGVEKAVIVNGHGGNTGILHEVAGQLSREGTLYTVVWMWTDAYPDEDDHAGKNETSFMLHLEPDLVGEPVQGDVDEWGKFVNGTMVAQYTHEFTENGVAGDATEATADHGEEFFEECVSNLVSLIEWIEDESRDYEALESFTPQRE